jgi:CubicO group peptidase (beta-lactamase class C family)
MNPIPSELQPPSHATRPDEGSTESRPTGGLVRSRTVPHRFPRLFFAWFACFAGAFLLATTALAAGWPGAQWDTATPEVHGLDRAKLEQARDYALTAGGSGLIIHRGKAVFAWGDQAQTYDLKSTSKSIGVTLLGVALKDGRVKLDDLARKHHPTFGVPPEGNAQTGWLDNITLRMLADQTAGFDKPGGFEPLLFEPGTQWAYSDGGPNWLAECLTLVYRADLNDLMFERVCTPLGITPADLRWRNHAYRKEPLDGLMRREFGSGFHANVNAMARLGYLYLREGWWAGEQILPPSFIHAVRHPDPRLAQLPTRKPEDYGRASQHYSLLWWNNRDGTIPGVPRDAYWSWGLFDSLIVVIPSLDLVIARAGPGRSWKREQGADHYKVLEPFLQPLAASVSERGAHAPSRAAAGVSAGHTLSPLIKEIIWAPTNSILRKARGSDNWPLTWADDGHLYTAYGDGHGFEPRLKQKLSLGLARVEGGPEDFQGINLRSDTAEDLGDGKRGRKASGMLSVDGTLYMLVRNAANAHLGWSTDRGATWTWADWKFTESFGCPTFLNFGRNYAGARDGYVYIYSHDSDSAYERADRFVMARVPKEKIKDRAAYEFFAGLKEGERPRPAGLRSRPGDDSKPLAALDSGGTEKSVDGAVRRDAEQGTPEACAPPGDAPRVVQAAGGLQPVWSKNIAERGAVFTNPGACYRSSVSYNAALKRYLWCQTGPGNDTRFSGGFTILDAPDPWGPWTVAFHTDLWDVGPGESMHLPTKWMSTDGQTVWLVFSGDDFFSVRKGVLRLSDQ